MAVSVYTGAGGGVASFNGRKGNVVPANGDYTKAQVGLGNVDNTSDANKPISNATQAALNDKQSKITANGILKGDGAGAVTAVEETEVQLVDLPIRAESIIIPKGRMRGDINGTGKVGTSDDVLNSPYFAGTTDPANPDSWVCDINADGKIDANDMQAIVSGILYSTPLIADYYNNWTYVKVDDLTGYWTTEISIADLTTSNNVVVNICETFLMGQFYKAEVSTGKVKIYATTPPITDIPAIVVISSGSGKGSIPSYLNESSVQPEIFWAIRNTTTQEELEAAWQSGKFILMRLGSNCFFASRENSTSMAFYSIRDYLVGNLVWYRCTDEGWSSLYHTGTLLDHQAAISLPTASWTGSDPYTQTVTIPNSTANTKVDIQPSEEIYDQLVADNVGYLAIKNVDGTLTAVAKGGKPSVDLTVQVTYNNVY